MKWFCATLFASLIGTWANAGDVTELRIECVDQQSVAGDDEIYLVFYVDGRKVEFSSNDEDGTHKFNILEMRDSTFHYFGSATRSKLQFTNKIEVLIRERDGIDFDALGSCQIGPNEQKSCTVEGGIVAKHKYVLSWKTN